MADQYVTKARQFRVDLAGRLRTKRMMISPQPRQAPNKIWVRPPGLAKFLSVVADRTLVVKRNAASLAINLQLEKSTGTNTSSLVGKSIPALPGSVVETRARISHAGGTVKRRGRPRIHSPERRVRRTLAAVIFIEDSKQVGDTVDRIVIANPQRIARLRVTDVNSLSQVDRNNLLTLVAGMADSLLP